MNQQINFLTSFPQKPIILETHQITLACIIVTLVMILISLSMVGKQIYYDAQISYATHQEEQAALNLQKTEHDYPLLSQSVPLHELVIRLEKTLYEKSRYYQILSHANMIHGFSENLGALSTIVPNGLWLTDINIDRTTGQSSIDGYLIKPTSISVFLEQLLKTKPFSNINFEYLTVKTIPKRPYDRFRIANYVVVEEENAPQSN